MGRRILLVTTDQQRYDTLGCNGGLVARTPVVDRLAASGVRYERAHPQSVVCMPSRSTILTGQHAEAVSMYYPVLDASLQVNAAGGGDTAAPQVHVNPIPRDWYHTDWVAERVISWLDSLADGEDWFCWVSFPDPHHPWDPPESEVRRVNWREVPLPAGYPERAAERERLIDGKPRHWRLWYDGGLVSNYEAPASWIPATLTPDQLREVTARNAVECELIDEALGRVLARIAQRGWDESTDVLFTTDHGELGGDFGLMFKGPYHVDGLMRLPLVWRLAPEASIRPAVVSAPVGLVDLAPTLCRIAGLPAAEWMQGRALPTDDDEARARGIERVLTEWDSELFGVDVHLRTIMRDHYVLTRYMAGSVHDGTEGELYDLAEDPLQRDSRFDDPTLRALRDDLLSDLLAHLPPAREPRLLLEAPV